MSACSLGLTIPNADMNFSCKRTKMIEDRLFVFTKNNEILVLIKKEDKINNVSYFEKDYLILTSMQEREEIVDVFIMKKANEIMTQNERIILVVTKSLVIYFCNLSDGLCISKRNLSNFKEDKIIHIASLCERFLLLIFERKAMLFDTFSQMIFKEESMKVLNKIPTDDNGKEEFLNFEVDKVYPIKENSFFILSKDKDTFFLSVPLINSIYHYTLDYEVTRIKIIKETFDISKYFNDESMLCFFSNQDFIFHNLNQKIRVSFLDSVEELTELSYLNSKAKFPIIYVNRITLNKEEKLLVLYKDLTCEIFTYDKKLREIKLFKKFVIMIEDEFISMKYVTGENVLIGYTENTINVFDLRRINKNDEKYVDKVISLKDIFDKKAKQMFFTNYFKTNFPKYVSDITSELSDNDKMFEITCSSLYCYSENKSLYYIVGTKQGTVAIIDIFFSESLQLNPVVFIDYHRTKVETLSIYENRLLIISSSDGTVSFTDISQSKIDAAIASSNIVSESTMTTSYEKKRRKESLDEYNQKLNLSYLNKVRNNSIYRKKSIDDVDENSKRIVLNPITSIKSFGKLQRIIPVVQLDHNFLASNEELKRKNASLLAFEMENSKTIVMRMDTMKILYKFNQAGPTAKIKAVYHLSYMKSLVFYLDNDTIKVSSYSTRTCDRYISDIDKIYDILRVEEKLGHYFLKPEKLDEFIEGIALSKLKFNEADLEDNKKKGTVKSKERDEISVLQIKKTITNSMEKQLFIKKLFENKMRERQQINITHNKFDAIWMRKIECMIIDEMISIMNNNELSDKLKKIKIMNLLYNPTLFMKIIDRYDSTTKGILGNYMKIGEQYNEFISINFEEYFSYLEKKMHELKDTKNVFRINYFNIVSLLHIWNFGIELDAFLYSHYKLYQPIFDFFPMIIGVDSSCSISLLDEAKIDENLNFSFKFSDHFKYFTENMKRILTTKEKKKELFTDKGQLLESHQGYLVNLKNYKRSTNLSHLLHLGLFGSLIAFLGFEENPHLCDFIENEKKIMKISTTKRQIEYSNFEMFHNFMYENSDDLTLANKDFLLPDYLSMEYNIVTKNKFDISVKMRFKLSLDSIMLYLNQVYRYIFNLINETNELYTNFSKLNKDSNIDYGNKLDFLSEYELSLITYLILYNSLTGNNSKEMPDKMMIKITEMLVLYVFKIINDSSMKITYSKAVGELLGKSTETLEMIYKDNMDNYAKFLIEFYSNSNIPINLDSTFKKYTIGNYAIIKSEESPNFLKIIIAKLLKTFGRTRIKVILKIIQEEFKRKQSENSYLNYLIEIIWLFFRDTSYKLVQFLPAVIGLIMVILSSTNKELKACCMDNSKRLLSCLILHYPMMAFHQNSQKLAVGADDGKIYIYDMASGNIWKNLNAHSKALTALTFDSTGNIIVSYSAQENLVKCWKIGLTNFFSNFFSQKDGYYKQQKFKPIKADAQISPDDILKVVSFKLMPKKEHEIILVREDKGVEIISL